MRLLRCLDGFVSDAERAFPFALATLRLVTLTPTDGPVREGACAVVVPEDPDNDNNRCRVRP